MPDVSGLTQSGARAFLEKYGFTNVSFSTEDSNAPKNVVIGQSPSVGTALKENDAIKIIISSGTTTTTTEATIKSSISVKLPTCFDSNGKYKTDTITIKVDGDTYLNQTVTLNGSNKVISVTSDGEKGQNVVVSLKNTGDLQTVATNGKNNQNYNVDFSGSSSDDRA